MVCRLRISVVKVVGGEKQRITLARLFLKKPRIFLFDEPTSALDSSTENIILHHLRELTDVDGCTSIMIAHRLSSVMDMDEIIVLGGPATRLNGSAVGKLSGTVVERGTHQQLLQQHGVYSDMWRTQQQNNNDLAA